jgi:aspartate/methionine/tyrosine aminotransferase
VDEKYMKDADGNPQTKDYAFVMQLAYEVGVIAVPCSPFYSKEDSALGEKYVRFAFCKQESMLLEAGQKML